MKYVLPCETCGWKDDCKKTVKACAVIKQPEEKDKKKDAIRGRN